MDEHLSQEQNNNQFNNNLNIKFSNRLIMVITSMLLALTFIISWTLWLLLYKNNVDELIDLINRVLLDSKINFVLNFKVFSIIVLVFGGSILLFITFPFIFWKKKGIFPFILLLFSLIVTLIILVGISLFIYFGFEYLKYYITSQELTKLIILALPMSLEVFFSVLLIISTIFVIFNNFNKKTKTVVDEKTNYNSKPIEHFNVPADEIIIPTHDSDTIQEKKFFEQEELPTQPSALSDDFQQKTTQTASLSDNFHQQPTQPQQFQQVQVQPPIPTEQPQGINIVITNNTAVPAAHENHEQVIENTTHAVPPTPQIIPNNVPNPDHNFDVTSSINIPSSANWTPAQIDLVWNKAEIVKGFNPNLYRKDYAGALIFKKSFIDEPTHESSPKTYNWTIIHQRPLAIGGTNDLNNLVPLHVINAQTKGENYPKWSTAVTFDGRENYLKRKKWKA